MPDDTGLRLRSIRLKPGVALDSLTNALTGLGTQMDPRVQNTYVERALSQQSIASAYRGSGLMRKIINIPAMDMVREGWNWIADDADITAIEKEERKHLVRQKVRQVEVLRGLGGGALIMGLPGNPATPAPETIGKGGLAFVHVVSRYQLQFDATQDDSRLPGYGEPTMYRMETTVGQIEIHPSRIIPFRGEPVPPVVMANFVEDFWGESRVAAVLDAVQDSDTARAAFAHLITRARNVRVGIPNLLEAVSTSEGEAAFQRRMRAFAMAETIFNVTVFDAGEGGEKGGGEQITDVQYNFAGVKDVMNAYGEWASAISDIPATRLLGRAPEGMNASGESQQKDWNKRVRAMQTLDLAPCLDRLNHYLVRSALGNWPEGLWYEFAPLDQPTENENAERFKVTMEAVEKLQLTATIPDKAFAEGVQSLMVDEGWLPGLEQALEKVPVAERFGIEREDEPDDPDAAREPSPARAAQDAWVTDATPRPLYVQRKLLNAAELIAWAKAQGFESTLPAEDMHVTVLYSRRPVDPMKIGESWFGDEDGGLKVKPGGPRAVERLGEDAIVLLFASSHLTWRHRDMIEAGGSHDYPEYQPHVTISYAAPEGLDIDAIKPFTGELRFGPEEFSTLDEDWKSKIEEA